MVTKGSGWWRTDYSKIKESEIKERYLIKKESMQYIAKSLGICVNTLKPLFKKWRIPIRDGKMENHSQWKGGFQIIQGYPATYNPKHQRARNNGYVFNHLLVVEKRIGKSIERKTPVHHIDFDKTNHKDENLYLCKGHKEHRNAHISLEMVARELYKKGIIGFKDGKYFIKESVK